MAGQHGDGETAAAAVLAVAEAVDVTLGSWFSQRARALPLGAQTSQTKLMDDVPKLISGEWLDNEQAFASRASPSGSRRS